jgi:hypothetical protein
VHQDELIVLAIIAIPTAIAVPPLLGFIDEGFAKSGWAILLGLGALCLWALIDAVGTWFERDGLAGVLLLFILLGGSVLLVLGVLKLEGCYSTREQGRDGAGQEQVRTDGAHIEALVAAGRWGSISDGIGPRVTRAGVTAGPRLPRPDFH